MKNIRILMTGAGAPGASGIIRCYRNNGERSCYVLGVDVKDKIPTINMLDDYTIVPMAKDPLFGDKILEIALKNHINVIQPLVTRELEIFAAKRELFQKNGIAVCVSPLENLRIANDKGVLMDVLAEHDVAIPQFYRAFETEQLIEACKKIGWPEKAVCFKPARSNGSRGFRIIDPTVNRREIFFDQKPNNVYTSLDEIVNILGNGKFQELLVMEYLPGKEYSVDMLFNHGKCLYALPRVRTSMVGGISVDCTVVKEKDVIEYAISIGEILNLHGNIGIQVKRDENGRTKILEINPRVQGSIVCCAAAGINLPYFGIKLAVGEEIPKLPVKWNTRMIRFWKESYYDANGQAFTY